MVAAAKAGQRWGPHGLRQRLSAAFAGASPRELRLLAALACLSFALVAGYALATRANELAGDQSVYDAYGRFFTEGHWWWAVAPFGYPHPSAWKAPGYPAWVGLWYSLLGPAPVRLELVQALLAPLTVLFTWLLARRISGPPAPILAAAVTAAFPFVWEFFGVLYPEALAIPLTLAALLAFLGRPPTRGRILAFGVLLGINLLVRPTSFFLLAGALAAWVAAAGWRRGIAATVAAGAIALLVVSPWTIRNLVTDRVGFVPISVQDAAAYGTFNPVSADDPSLPYAWRPNALVSLSEFRNAKSEAALRSDLQRRAIAFIRAHPASVIEAFYWNGIRRFWDLQSPARVLQDARFQGRARATTIAGLAIYWCLLPLAAVGLWRLRRRREIAYPVLAMAAVASLAFTIVASTRYRAPLEPVIAILACSLAARAQGPPPSPAARAAGIPASLSAP